MMRWLFRRGQAQMLSAYIDGLIVTRRIGRDRPGRGERDRGGDEDSLDGLVELAQILSTVEFRVPADVRDGLDAQLAIERDALAATESRFARHGSQASAAGVSRDALAATESRLLERRVHAPAADSARPDASAALEPAGSRGRGVTSDRSRRRTPVRALLGAVGVAAVLTAAVFDWRLTRVSASELLRESSTVLRSTAHQKDVVAHRIVRLEQRDLTRGGRLVGRQRVETWEDGDRGVLARRAFDDTQRLIAGRWRDRDGDDRTVYARESRLALDLRRDAPPPGVPFDGLLTAWQTDLSADAFLAMLPRSGKARVVTSGDHYVVAYVADAPQSAALRAATLTLRRDTLWPVRQTVVVAHGGAVDEFRFEEASFEQVPESRVAAQVFSLDASLLEPTPAEPAPLAHAPVAAPAPVAPPLGIPRETLVFDAWNRLHRFDACLDEQTGVAIDARSQVAVHAFVLDEGRGELLRRTFESYVAPEALTLDVEVRAPASSRPSSAGAADAAGDSGARTAPPALAAVREHFRGRVGFEPESVIGPQLDEATRQFAAWTLERSARRLQETGALARHLAQWSPEAARVLDLDARAAWVSMLRQHAKAFAQETEMLRLQLSAVFVPIPAGDTDAPEPSSPHPADVIARLHALAAEQDRQIRHAFAPASVSAGAAAAQDSPRFGEAQAAQLVRGLAQSERLARGFDDPQLLDR